MTDAGQVTPEMGKYLERAQYLVIEANHDPEMLADGPYPPHLKVRIKSQTGHLCNVDCAEAIARYMTEQLQHVWLCHLSEENNHPELARKTVESVLRSYGIVAGKDFQLDVLKRTMPTGIFELI
jgi:phosphoribosyl 1,2-cyclic phosphodiesterase